MKSSKISKKFLAYLIPVILVAGTALGAGVWLLNVEVPVEYDEPYTISMSQSEIDENNDGYEWYELPFREVTRFEETAYFGENAPDFEYYQHVRIENPEDSGPLTIEYEVESEEHVEFMVMDELVEPGDVGEGEFPEREEEVEDTIGIEDGETKQFTVIHIVDDVEKGGEEDIYWSFYETDNPIENIDEEEEFATIQGAIDEASDGDTLELNDDIVWPSGLRIEKDLEIVGNDYEVYVEGRIIIDDDSDITMSDLHFTGPQTSWVISVSSGCTIDLRGSTFSEFRGGVYLNTADGSHIEDNTFEDFTYAAMGIEGNGDVTIEGNDFNDADEDADYYIENFVLDEGTMDDILENNDFDPDAEVDDDYHIVRE